MIVGDNPWKDVCDKKLKQVFQVLYRRVYRMLNWTDDCVALDQELRKFTPESEAGGRIADRLIRAMTKEGDERYFHMEVQGKQEAAFPRRMHTCNLRAEERFNSHVISMAILTDENTAWHPRQYVAGQIPVQDTQGNIRYLDARTLKFLTVKLLRWRERIPRLEAMRNPFGVFLVAQLEALRTRHDDAERQSVKLRLLRNLRDRKMSSENLRFWSTCVDWFLQLPDERERVVRETLAQLDKESSVPYFSFIEREARSEGLSEGRKEGRKEGRVEGKLIAQIQMCQLVLKQAQTPEEDLANLSPESLARLADDLLAQAFPSR